MHPDDFRYLDRGYYDNAGTVELALTSGGSTRSGRWQLGASSSIGGGLAYNRDGLAASGRADLDPFYFRGTLEATARRPLGGKFAAMNWNVMEIDGHNMQLVVEALEESRNVKGRPTCIVAHTITGKGVSFMENDPKWHGVAPTKEECAKALAEIGV